MQCILQILGYHTQVAHLHLTVQCTLFEIHTELILEFYWQCFTARRFMTLQLPHNYDDVTTAQARSISHF